MTQEGAKGRRDEQKDTDEYRPLLAAARTHLSVERRGLYGCLHGLLDVGRQVTDDLGQVQDDEDDGDQQQEANHGACNTTERSNG